MSQEKEAGSLIWVEVKKGGTRLLDRVSIAHIVGGPTDWYMYRRSIDSQNVGSANERLGQNGASEKEISQQQPSTTAGEEALLQEPTY